MGVWHLMILGPQEGKGHFGASPGFMLRPVEKSRAGGVGEAQALFQPLWPLCKLGSTSS